MNRRYRDPRRMQEYWHTGTSAKDALRGLAGLALIAAGMFWFPIQWQLVQRFCQKSVCIWYKSSLSDMLAQIVLLGEES